MTKLNNIKKIIKNYSTEIAQGNHDYPFKLNNKQVISKKTSTLGIAGPAALTR